VRQCLANRTFPGYYLQLKQKNVDQDKTLNGQIIHEISPFVHFVCK